MILLCIVSFTKNWENFSEVLLHASILTIKLCQSENLSPNPSCQCVFVCTCGSSHWIHSFAGNTIQPMDLVPNVMWHVSPSVTNSWRYRKIKSWSDIPKCYVNLYINNSSCSCSAYTIRYDWNAVKLIHNDNEVR